MAKKRAVIYARKSTDDRKQDGHSHSVTEQLDCCRKIVATQGYKLVLNASEEGDRDYFCDDNYSGRTWPKGQTYDTEAEVDRITVDYLSKKPASRRRRPDFGRICDLISQGEVDVIVVRDSTRLARPKFMSGLINWLPLFLRDNGVWVHSQAEGLLDPDDEQRLMVSIIRDAILDQELSKRARFAQDAKRKLNLDGWWTAQCPYGYRSTNESKVYEQDPERATVVKRMFDTVLREKKVLAFIRTLNAEGKRTAKGRLWRLRQFQNVVASPLYMGKMNVGTKAHPQYITCHSFPDPIIDEPDWWTVRRIISERSQESPASRTSYPCSGIIFCADCGRRMQVYGPNKKPKWRKYWCDGSYTVKSEGKCKATVNMLGLHRIIAPLAILKSKYDEEAIEAAEKARRSLPKMTRRLNELEERRQTLLDQVDDERTTMGIWMDAVRRLSEQIEELQQKVHAVETVPEPKPASRLHVFANALALDKPERYPEFREVVRSVLKRIDVSRLEVKVTLWDGNSFALRRGMKTHKYHRALPRVASVPFRGGKALHLLIEQGDPARKPLLSLPHLLVEEVGPETFRPE